MQVRSGRKRAFFIFLTILFISCSSEKERLLAGKWSIAGRMMGGAPASFWFRGNGTVIAPWEKHSYAMLSTGKYKIVDEKYIHIKMKEGYYKGNTFIFRIISLDENEMILGSEFEKFRLKKIKE